MYRNTQCQHTVTGANGTSGNIHFHFTISYSYTFSHLRITVVWVKYLSSQHATEIKDDTKLSYRGA